MAEIQQINVDVSHCDKQPKLCAVIVENVVGFMQKVCNASRVCYAGRAYYIYVRPLAGLIVAKIFSLEIVNGKTKGSVYLNRDVA